MTINLKAQYIAAREAYQAALTWKPANKSKRAKLERAMRSAWLAYKAG